MLAYLDGNHYDAVYTIPRKEAMELCQGEWPHPLWVCDNCRSVAGILYTALMEKVFGHQIPVLCKKKLTNLRQFDVTKMNSFKGKSPGGYSKVDPDSKSLLNLHRHYSMDEIVAMSWTMYLNSPVVLHRQMKESMFVSGR